MHPRRWLKKGSTESFSILKLIEAVAAVAFVLFLTWLAFIIISAVLPSDDKGTAESFKTLYNLMNAKSSLSKSYDSTRMTLYLDTKYNIIFFPEGERKSCGKAYGQTPQHIVKPESCTLDESCLCLYKGIPYIISDNSVEKRNENVVECLPFDAKINMLAFDINDGQCVKALTTKFTSIIVAEHSVSGSSSKDMYVWIDNDNNRVLDEEFKKYVCVRGSSVCIGKKEGEYISDYTDYPAVWNECKDTLSAKCVLGTNNQECNLLCSQNKLSCGTGIKKCSDYSRYSLDGSLKASYMLKGSAAEYACINDDALCKVGPKGCSPLPLMYFYCIDGIQKCSDKQSNFLMNIVSSCLIKNEFSTKIPSELFFISALSSGECIKFLESNGFSQSVVYALKPNVNHDPFLNNAGLQKKCGFVISPTGEVVIVGSTDKECLDTINAQLVQTYYCAEK